MPLVDANDPETWAAWYSCQSDDGTRTLGYEREAKSKILGNDHWSLLNALGIQPGQSIVLVGCGFAWVGEDWEAAGYGPILNLDTSTWIHANKGEHAATEILNENILDPDVRADIAGADWVITEDVMPLLSNEEAVQLAEACRAVGDNVAHWISATTAGLGPGNWQSAAVWKALLAPDLIVCRGRGEAV